MSAARVAVVAIIASCTLLPGQFDVQAGGHEDRKGLGTVVVIATEDSSGKAIRWVDVRIRRPHSYRDELHWEPEWQAYTDSTGHATLKRIPSGMYELQLCSGVHEPKDLTVRIAPGLPDTMRFHLTYVGPPRDGRRCEVIFDFGGVQGAPPWEGGVSVVATKAETGRPVEFGCVVVLDEEAGAVTDEQGRATLSNLTPGVKRLRVLAIDGRDSITSVSVRAGKMDTLRMGLSKKQVDAHWDLLQEIHEGVNGGDR